MGLVARQQITVGLADMAVTNNPATELVTYSMGSCLGVTVYDPVNQVGGLLHVLLPDSSLNPDKAQQTPCMFVDTAIPALLQNAYEMGAEKINLILKVVGGADMLGDIKLFNIGRRNYEALLQILSQNGIDIQAEAVGGHISRTIRLEVSDGALVVQTPGEIDIVL